MEFAVPSTGVDELASLGTCGDQYILLDMPPRKGGMAQVQKVVDSRNGKFCAVKRMTTTNVNDPRPKESFNREFRALDAVSGHKNIVSLIEAGHDKEGQYLVLEWAEYNLEDTIKEHGPYYWDEFFQTIGKPLLEAIIFAQSRGWTHRDIKPQNILFSSEGTPLISDYGIAKQTSNPAFGMTFNDFRSVPFTPADSSFDNDIESIDCYSWAAISLACLQGKIPTDYHQLNNILVGLDDENIPVEILRRCLSNDPKERPPLASVLSAELEGWYSKRRSAQNHLELIVKLSRGCMQHLKNVLETEADVEVQKLVIEELSEVPVGLTAAKLDEGGRRGLRISAVSWVFEAYSPDSHGGPLVIKKAWNSPPSELEKLREQTVQIPISFSFHPTVLSEDPPEILSKILLEIDKHAAERAVLRSEHKREEIFRLWYASLREKADFEARKNKTIVYVNAEIGQRYVTLTTNDPINSDIIGQPSIIQRGSRAVFCEVVDVTFDQIIVIVTGGDPQSIPIRGNLEINRIAAEKSIDRQRRALDAVNFDRAVNPRLKALILEPEKCTPPDEAAYPIALGSEPFDPEKEEILKKALGLRDLLSIQGPPGTGKTRLIEEILVQYLTRYPKHRVLLSSQTHVALDNVIERLNIRRSDIDIVRIGRIDDPKISAHCRQFVLDQKAQKWAEQAQERAISYLSNWAEAHGISRENVEVSIYAQRLYLLMKQLNSLKMLISETERRLKAIEIKSDESLTETGSTQNRTLEDDSLNNLETQAHQGVERRKILSEIDDVRAKLRETNNYGAELAENMNETDLADWSKAFIGTQPHDIQFRKLLTIQEEWLMRVGKSNDFHAAMLASAQVVAGTCIGVAGVRGMGEISYDLCIVDEASKATATEILVPMSRSKKWILVGDPKQLPPYFEAGSFSNLGEANELEIKKTLLDRFIAGLPEHSIGRLSNQYRMVQPIGELISHLFYESKLSSPRKNPDITLPGLFSKSVTWLSTIKKENRYENKVGSSYSNDSECEVIISTLRSISFIANQRKKNIKIVIISGYNSQISSINNIIKNYTHEWEFIDVICSTVDSFQGSQADVCIYSVTRSNRRGNIGFLKSIPRLNVALSRGRDSLIVVGDDEFCRTAIGDNPFRRIIEYIDEHPHDCERREAL